VQRKLLLWEEMNPTMEVADNVKYSMMPSAWRQIPNLRLGIESPIFRKSVKSEEIIKDEK